ncbi:MAG TPA: hypothetical protein VLC47_02945 [Burkholderiales bacterium]|nr:hypothetical protein [Burkholderiales bacterium]
MLPLLALLALVGIAGTLAVPLVADAPLPARVHLTFAIGIAPLILAALGYFVPVLTRSAPAPSRVLAAPFAALAAGVLAVAYFAAPEAWPLAYPAAALIELAAVGTVLAWIVGRARNSIGTPHPCTHWYVAATACLAAALVAILAMPYATEQYIAFKRLHLHLNLLGFVGMTAIGTLQVLVPTAAGAADPRAAARLDADLKWALAGTLLIAAGAAWFPLVAAVGLFLWLSLAIRIGRDWLTLYPERLLAWHGAPPSLAGALAGFTLVLLLGALHGGGTLDPRNAVAAFILAVLLPLVTGALTHLLPIWLRPGPQTAWHDQARAALGRYAAVRACLFVAGGMLAGFGIAAGTLVAALGLVLFFVQGLRAAVAMRG